MIHHECSVEACGFGFAGLRYDGGEEVLDRTAVAEVGHLVSEASAHRFDVTRDRLTWHDFTNLWIPLCWADFRNSEKFFGRVASLGALLVKFDDCDCDATADDGAYQRADPG